MGTKTGMSKARVMVQPSEIKMACVAPSQNCDEKRQACQRPHQCGCGWVLV